MKKIIIAVVFAAILTGGSTLFAQQSSREGHESEYYYVNITLEKIYPHSAGYIVQYRKGINRVGTTYLPSEWFTHTAAKGEIIKLPPGKDWPTMSVYYKNGEFSHVRLYVHRQHTHQTWGNVPQNANINERFENIETIQLDF